MTGSRFGAARFARARHSLAVSLSYGVGMGNDRCILSNGSNGNVRCSCGTGRDEALGFLF